MRYLLILLFSIHLFAVDASMKIEKDVEHRSRIALVDGSSVSNGKLFKILLSDFKISGHFLADSSLYKSNFSSGFIAPNLKSKEYIVKYRFTQANGVKLEIRLLKASDGSQIFEKSYAIQNSSKMPFLVHKAVYDINRVLKYPDIGWINRYVVFSRYTAPKRSEILLADYTFTYQKVIIRGGLNLFPKWADSAQKSFYYTSYAGLIPTLNKINIYTGSKSKVASSEGMIVCSDVSPDGSKMLLTMSPEGQPDIYEMSLFTGSKTRVTKFNGIDVNGKYLGNGSQIVFVSNRLGYANIFKKSINSAAVQQVVFHGRNNNAVDAHGNKIIYCSREGNNAFGGNRFNLYLTSANGGSSRPLTTTGSNQFPRFSTDGSVILYIKQNGNSSSIGYINLGSSQSLLFPLGGRKIQSIDW
ncbi:Tol-Pal system protein TolB [Sulfurovum sp. NBC37-1]|uniref:Tol-Pal system protein TolB n=1 Tax=Sulfurovum sp. (strain NBC37-1) TaxID=387093 RepID=UPI0001587A05|nr:Tol-Pal system protein TolB [Sulfurovum sp. NBC37-1]BAF72711.1 Tol biopolymer transport system component TolB [Sulfurovum sp. NBC37-1]